MNTPAPTPAALAASLLEHAAVHDAEASPYSPEQAQWAADLRAAAAALSSPAPAQAAPSAPLLQDVDRALSKALAATPEAYRRPKAALSAVPEGYAVVPVEPTPAMRLAGRKAPDMVDDLWRAMLAAAPVPAAPVVAPWQPIETAPKDGSLFLCWVSAVRYGETDEGQQYQQDASQADFCSWRDNPCDLPGHGYFDPCCGQIADAQGVTHWMPIPAAPKD